jgi:phage protein D
MSEIFFRVTVEGEDVSDLLERLEVEESDTQADMATLTFANRSLVLADILQEGLMVEIDLGRQDAHALIFRGIMTGIRPGFPSQGLPKVEVQAMDSLIQLGLQPKTRRWWNTSVAQIVRDIAQFNGLGLGDIEPTEDALIDEMRPYHQIEETDLAFLLRLGRDYDSKLYVEHSDQDTLNFVSTRRLNSSPTHRGELGDRCQP